MALSSFALCGVLAFVVLSGGRLELPWRSHVPVGPSSVAAGREQLRFDGLYQASTGPGRQLPLRFYPQGDVVAMASVGSAEQVANVIRRGRPGLGHGEYHLQDERVSACTRSPLGSVDYEGTIGPGSIVFFVHSQITGAEDTRRFAFHPASFSLD